MAVALAAILLATGCAGSSSSGGSGSGNGASTSSDGKTVEIDATVKDGKVSPPTHRVKVDKGATVKLMVTSDVDDEVHVHGYDIEKEVSAGEPATIEFTADQTGTFEVETHESNLQLLQLQVS